MRRDHVVMQLDDISFDHLAPRAKHYEHTFDDVRLPASNPKPIVLHLAFCGRGSKYWNALMKWKPLADEKAATKRAADAFARYGVVGWENAGDLPFSHTAVAKVFEKLIDADRPEKIERAIAVAMNPDNFTESVDAAEVAELGKL